MRFTLYLERDVAIEVKDDKQAMAIALAIDLAIDRQIESFPDSAELNYVRTTCHRGLVHKCVYERELGEP